MSEGNPIKIVVVINGTVKPSRDVLLGVEHQLTGREATGRSVLSMTGDVKMDTVASLLSVTSMPVSDIVSRIGHSSTRNVFTQFKRRYGMTMSAYRASAKAGKGGLHA